MLFKYLRFFTWGKLISSIWFIPLLSDDKTIQKLVKMSQDMRLRAYCKYSKVQVGAALLCEDGTIFTGKRSVMH